LIEGDKIEPAEAKDRNEIEIIEIPDDEPETQKERVTVSILDRFLSCQE
jgi:hypothetical protein